MLAGTAMAQSAQHKFINTLMPEPAHLTVESGYLPLTSSFTSSERSFHNHRLDAAVQRAMRHLENQVGFVVSPAKPDTKATFVITVDGPGETVQGVDENESYSLQITPREVHLDAPTVVGAMRGLQTLLQLVQYTPGGYFLPAVFIQDQPRFPWRGLMLDCSRHFEPISVIKQTLQAMAAVKMNVFHWHLSDDQGFRMQSKVFPLLTQDGSDGKFYTLAQVREVIAYARARGIRVVPEFDMPGHSTSWVVGYPWLASAPGPFSIERHFGIFDPVMDPTKQSTYNFLDAFFAEVTHIFPDQYIHIGGDENNGVEWKNNPKIQAFMQAHNLDSTSALQAYFNTRVYAILKAHGKKMIGWDEVLTPNLPKNVAIQSWRGPKSLDVAAKEGHDAILSAGFYLDQMQTAAQHYQVDPLPVNSGLTTRQMSRILGGEACMWGEYVDASNVESRIWPRAAAIAERLWSPRTVTSVPDMYRRLAVENLRIERLGLNQISQEDVSLRALAGTRNIAPLKVLARVLEPVDFGIRGNWSTHHGVTTLTPLDHLVDALPPDPPSRRHFAALMNTYLQDPATHLQQQLTLAATFHRWTAIQPRLLPMMAHAPLLEPALPRARQLNQFGLMGSQALLYLQAGIPAPAGWKEHQLAILQQAQQQVDLTQFTILQPMTNLVNKVPEAAQ